MKKKIKYLCTPFCLKAAEELNEIGVDMYKIGSGEIHDLPFINELLKFKKPVIFSTGMSTPRKLIKFTNLLTKGQKINLPF